jgi:hypothetical protein
MLPILNEPSGCTKDERKKSQTEARASVGVVETGDGEASWRNRGQKPIETQN